MAFLAHATTSKAGRYRRRMMGWNALLQADLRALSRSWVVRLWLLLLLLSFFVVPIGMLVAKRPTPIPASTILTAYLALFLNVWITVIIVLSAGSVSLEAEVVADGILCRACTRTQYILAKLAARALVLGGVYCLLASAAGYGVWRYAPRDVTWMTMLTGISIVGMALLMVVSLGVTMSVIFNNTIVSVISLLLLWYVAGAVFAFMGAEYMSPASLTRNLPEILRDNNAPRLVSCSATETSLSVTFSKEVKPEAAESIDNYTVESPKGTRHTPKTAVYDKATGTVVLSGFDFSPGKTVTITAQGVTDEAGNSLSPAADSATSNKIAADLGRRRGEQAKAEQGEGREESVTVSDSPTPSVSRSSTPHDKQDREPARVVRVSATRTSASVTFSKNVDAAWAEKLKNYTVESPLGTTHTPRTAAYNASASSVLLSGLTFKAGSPVKVTVKNVTNPSARIIDSRHNTATFREVQTWKYFAGFGAPMLFFAALAAVWFSRRDL